MTEGRTCPLAYRYRPEDLCAEPETLDADVIYVIGGLYGNPHALDEIERMALAEERLQGTAAVHPDIQARLDALPRYRCLLFGGLKVLVLHGDPESLAGWGQALRTMASACRCGRWGLIWRPGWLTLTSSGPPVPPPLSPTATGWCRVRRCRLVISCFPATPDHCWCWQTVAGRLF